MSSLDHEPERAGSSSSAAKPRKRRAPVITKLPSTIAERYEAVKRHSVENTTLEEVSRPDFVATREASAEHRQDIRRHECAVHNH